MLKAYRLNSTMPVCVSQRNQPGCSFDKPLPLTIGSQGELLSERGGQNPLARTDLAHMIPRACYLGGRVESRATFRKTHPL
jgi:hypothetical protein